MTYLGSFAGEQDREYLGAGGALMTLNATRPIPHGQIIENAAAQRQEQRSLETTVMCAREKP